METHEGGPVAGVGRYMTNRTVTGKLRKFAEFSQLSFAPWSDPLGRGMCRQITRLEVDPLGWGNATPAISLIFSSAITPSPRG